MAFAGSPAGVSRIVLPARLECVVVEREGREKNNFCHGKKSKKGCRIALNKGIIYTGGWFKLVQRTLQNLKERISWHVRLFIVYGPGGIPIILKESSSYH